MWEDYSHQDSRYSPCFDLNLAVIPAQNLDTVRLDER